MRNQTVIFLSLFLFSFNNFAQTTSVEDEIAYFTAAFKTQRYHVYKELFKKAKEELFISSVLDTNLYRSDIGYDLVIKSKGNQSHRFSCDIVDEKEFGYVVMDCLRLSDCKEVSLLEYVTFASLQNDYVRVGHYFYDLDKAREKYLFAKGLSNEFDQWPTLQNIKKEYYSK